MQNPVASSRDSCRLEGGRRLRVVVALCLVMGGLAGCSSKNDSPRANTDSTTNSVDEMLVMHDATPPESESASSPSPEPAPRGAIPAPATRPVPAVAAAPMTAMRPMPPVRAGDGPVPNRQSLAQLRLGRQSPYDLARERMVTDQLVARGFSNATVLDAMRKVPRHNFVVSEQLSESYEDRSLSISFNFSSGTVNRMLETPYVIASLAQQLVAEPSGRVLEIGTGPAYQTAVLSLLAAQVYTLDDENIAQNARANLQRFDFTGNVVIRGGDTAKGWAEAAPFDTIILNRHDLVSADIVAQLKSNGRLIVPVGEDGYLRVFQKTGGQLVNLFTLYVRPTPVSGNKVDVPPATPILLAPAN